MMLREGSTGLSWHLSSREALLVRLEQQSGETLSSLYPLLVRVEHHARTTYTWPAALSIGAGRPGSDA